MIPDRTTGGDHTPKGGDRLSVTDGLFFDPPEIQGAQPCGVPRRLYRTPGHGVLEGHYKIHHGLIRPGNNIHKGFKTDIHSAAGILQIGEVVHPDFPI